MVVTKGVSSNSKINSSHSIVSDSPSNRDKYGIFSIVNLFECIFYPLSDVVAATVLTSIVVSELISDSPARFIT